MSDLTGLPEFLLACFAEDEAVAQQAAAAKPGAHYSDASQVGAAWLADEGMVVGADDLWEDEGADSLAMDPAAAAHVARWDPARVLAECEAKREMVEDLRDELANQHDPEPTTMQLAEQMLLTLALPYADRPDYREEWKP